MTENFNTCALCQKKTYMKEKYQKKHDEALEELKKEEEGETSAEVYSCKVCMKICTGVECYNAHLIGKYHRKKLRQKEANECQCARSFNDEEEHSICVDCGGMMDAEVQKEIKNRMVLDLLKEYPEELLKDTNLIYCMVCYKSFNGPQCARQHVNSLNHKLVQEEKKKIDELLKRQKMSSVTGEKSQA